MKPNQPPTIDDVARAAGVSTATISRAINDPDKVAKTTRDRINAAIETLGYTPHFGARAMASSRFKTVGAIIPTMANAMFASGLQAFQEALSEAGVTLLVGTTGYDPEAEMHQIRALMMQGASGLMLIGSDRPDATRRFLSLRNVPYVQAWSTGPAEHGVFAGFDNRLAAQRMTECVLAKGHRRIAMVAGISAGNDRARERIAGVRAAIDASDGAELVAITEAPYLIGLAGDAFEKVWAAKPTAVIGGSDVLAAGAVVRAREMGLSVPDDVSFTGFDDIGLSLVSSPALTTVRVPQSEMGRAAAAILLDMLAGKPTQSALLETEIIERASLVPPKS